MRRRDAIAVGFGTLALTVGTLQALQPKTVAELEQQRRDGLLEQLSDADEGSRQRMREQGQDLLEADSADRNRPGEHRRPEPHVRIRPWRF